MALLVWSTDLTSSVLVFSLVPIPLPCFHFGHGVQACSDPRDNQEFDAQLAQLSAYLTHDHITIMPVHHVVSLLSAPLHSTVCWPYSP